MKSDLVGSLVVNSGKQVNKRLIKQEIEEIESIISNYYELLKQEDIKENKDLAEHIATQTATDAGFKNVGTISNSVSDIIVIGAPVSQWWQKQAADTFFQFSSQVRQGMSEGETIVQLMNRIKPVIDVSKRNARSLVHTAVQSIANEARLATYRANSDVVPGLKQFSTLDSHTSNICIAYSGATWDLQGNPTKGNHLPFNGGCPRHVNCRSQILQDKDRSNITRASDEGQINADITFHDFLKGKSKAYQDELLGPGRAELWRNGTITLRDLLDMSGRTLTLDELRNLH